MNFRIRILLVVGALAVVLIIFSLYQNNKGEPNDAFDDKSAQRVSDPSAGNALSKDTSIDAGVVPSSRSQMPGGIYEPADPRWKERERLKMRDSTYEWKTPIAFYGRVLDTDQVPISGVTVQLEWTDLSRDGTSMATRQTDADGLFSLSGVTGKSLGVRSLKRSGYVEAAKTNPHEFEYAAFWEPKFYTPDPSNPLIFHMRKKGEPADLIVHPVTLFSVKSDGSSNKFDLTTGRRVEGIHDDLSLQITKGNQIGSRFDWTAEVQAAGQGGLIESTEKFMVIAPLEGYTSKWLYTQKSTDESYQSEVRVKFFVKTDDGKYARVELRILPSYDSNGAVDLSIYLNPKPGDRNLEFERK